MDFAERLKKTRVERKLSQSELGKLVGIHYTQIGRYENKGAQPSADILTRIADALGVSVDFLMHGSTEDIANKSFADQELIQQFKIIDKMDEQDRSVVKIFLDAFITKRQIQRLVQ